MSAAHFYERLRRRAESGWRSYVEPDFFDPQVIIAYAWQRGTQWRGGMTVDEILRAERRWGLRFPPEYRAFLATLHTTDRPRRGVHHEGDRRLIVDRPSFTDWTIESDVASLLTRLVDGILFDVEANRLWLRGWGERPDTAEARRGRVVQVLSDAPTLVPILEPVYLLPGRADGADILLSVSQSDIQPVAVGLRQFLLWQLADVLGLAPRHKLAEDSVNRTLAAVRDSPFWGELISYSVIGHQ